MSRVAFTQFQALAQQAGIPASADSGNALLYGVHIGWAYREPQRQLQIDVNRTPFFVSDEQI